MYVTDHALLRYLQRVQGMDIGKLRSQVSCEVESFVNATKPHRKEIHATKINHCVPIVVEDSKGLVLLTLLPPDKEFDAGEWQFTQDRIRNHLKRHDD